MSDKEQLIGMGFESERVEWALHATNNRGLQPAMDHLVEHSEKPVPTDWRSTSSTLNPSSSNPGSNSNDYDEEDQAALADMLSKKGQSAQDEMATNQGEAKSLKCDDCGRILKNAAFASFHAEKSGHTNFSESQEEIKPLTEEEKKQRLEELRAKLAEKRAAQSKIDAQENKANEQIRRKAGQDMGQAREELKKKEALKEAAAKKAEKIADAQAKARVKAQIEADKRERAERTAREKALREGTLPTGEDKPVTVSKPASSIPSSTANSNSKETRLRVRGSEGTWMGTMDADQCSLKDVEDKMKEEGKASGPLKFSTTFPRKVFSDSDKTKTLRELGLVPNAALEASPA